MASLQNRGRLGVHNENLGIPQKKAAVTDKSNFKTATKKGGGLGNRKAFKDITNISSIRQGTSVKTKRPPKEEVDGAGEGFLHDHSKCIEANRGIDRLFILDTLFPGHDSFSPIKDPESDIAKGGLDDESFDLVPDDYLDKLLAESGSASPKSSPLRWTPTDSPRVSPPDSPEWQFKSVKFVLKPKSDFE